MFVVQWVKVLEHERGLLFRNQRFERILEPGRHVLFDPLNERRLDRVSVRESQLTHADLDVIVKAGAFAGEDSPARVVDLADHERALVRVNKRLHRILGPGLHVLWTVFHEVEIEVVDASRVVFEHSKLPLVLEIPGAHQELESVTVPADHVGILYRDGKIVGELAPGLHAFWRRMGSVRVTMLDLRERVLDLSGQELLTGDRVSLRLNALVTYRVTDPLRAVASSDDYQAALYRQAQLVLREVVGTRELDELLTERETVVRELNALVTERVQGLGVDVTSLGVRDVILPGEMKALLNRVTEAKKAAEAALVTRREETAAMRSQANTARLFESNPTLMRLRELEVLEKVSEKAQLQVVLGEKGLGRVVKIL